MSLETWEERGDGQLVVAALVGNLAAYDELARRFRPAMLAVAEQVVGCPLSAEDVVQDALLLAFKALPQLEQQGRFASWLYAITRNQALRYLSRSNCVEPRSDLDQLILKHTQAVAPSPADIFFCQQQHEELRDAIEQLDPDLGLVLRLCYWDEMPQQRIADFLHLPLTTVKWRLHKAKQELKKRLANR